jgi:hypothetical protein
LYLFQTDLKRALTSWGFIAGIMGMAAAIFFGSFESILPFLQGFMEVLPAGFHEQMILTALSSDIMMFCVPILAALPYTAAFIEEYKSGYLKEYLPRSGVRPYIIGKVFATGLSGGLVLFLGIILIYIAFALLFTPMEVLPQMPDDAMNGTMAASAGMVQMAVPSMFADIIGRAFLFFLAGFFWSLVGALFATVTMSRYMAYAFPFILYYVLIILCQRYFTGIYILNPQEWTNAAMQWPGGAWGMILFFGEIILITGIAYAMMIKRRLSDA